MCGTCKVLIRFSAWYLEEDQVEKNMNQCQALLGGNMSGIAGELQVLAQKLPHVAGSYTSS